MHAFFTVFIVIVTSEMLVYYAAVVDVHDVLVMATRPLADRTPTFLSGATFIGSNVVLGSMFARGQREGGVSEIERQVPTALVENDA